MLLHWQTPASLQVPFHFLPIDNRINGIWYFSIKSRVPASCPLPDSGKRHRSADCQTYFKTSVLLFSVCEFKSYIHSFYLYCEKSGTDFRVSVPLHMSWHHFTKFSFSRQPDLACEFCFILTHTNPMPVDCSALHAHNPSRSCRSSPLVLQCDPSGFLSMSHTVSL